MRKITLEKVNEKIRDNHKNANAVIRISSGSHGRVKRSRTRTPGEVQALNEIAVARWREAVRAGKIKKSGKKSMCYDYR